MFLIPNDTIRTIFYGPNNRISWQILCYQQIFMDFSSLMETLQVKTIWAYYFLQKFSVTNSHRPCIIPLGSFSINIFKALILMSFPPCQQRLHEFKRRSRLANLLRCFTVELDRYHHRVYSNRLFLRTSRLWQSLMVSSFPATHILQKFHVNRYLLFSRFVFFYCSFFLFTLSNSWRLSNCLVIFRCTLLLK